MWKDPRTGKIYKTLPRKRFLKNGLHVKHLVPYNEIVENIPLYSEPDSIKQVVDDEKLEKVVKERKRYKKGNRKQKSKTTYKRRRKTKKRDN